MRPGGGWWCGRGRYNSRVTGDQGRVTGDTGDSAARYRRQGQKACCCGQTRTWCSYVKARDTGRTRRGLRSVTSSCQRHCASMDELRTE